MAFTNAQKISVHLIINIPYSSTYTVHDGMGTAVYGGYTSEPGTISPVATITQEIRGYLDAVAANETDKETKIKSLITEYDAIALKTSKIEAGNVGPLSNVTHDYDARRARIREEMENLVPFVARWKYLQKVSESGNGVGSIPFVR